MLFARTLKPPLAYDGSPVILIKRDKQYVAVGYAASHTLLVLHDGKHDHFNVAPASVRKHFKDTPAIREFVNTDESSKIFALVLEDYKSKGQYRYELSNVRLRNGYGRANLKNVSAQGTSPADVVRFFGGSKGSQSQPSNAATPEPPEPIEEPSTQLVQSALSSCPEGERLDVDEDVEAVGEATDCEPQESQEEPQECVEPIEDVQPTEPSPAIPLETNQSFGSPGSSAEVHETHETMPHQHEHVQDDRNATSPIVDTVETVETSQQEHNIQAAQELPEVEVEADITCEVSLLVLLVE